jgi:hypothetical protein
VSRYEHFLAPAVQAGWPDKIVCVQCETSLSSQEGSEVSVSTLRRWYCTTMIGHGGHYGRLKHFSGETDGDFWSKLSRFAEHSGRILIVSHLAVDQLSLLRLWDRLETGEVSIDNGGNGSKRRGAKRWVNPGQGSSVLEDPPTIVQICIPGCKSKVTWIDSRNYGIQRTPADGDGAAFCWRLSTALREIIRTLIIRKLGGLKLTAGSQAVHSWRYLRFTDTVLCHTRSSVLKLERDGYYGGRCECFRIGEIQGPIYHLDFKSMYPSIMATHPLPIALDGSMTLRSDIIRHLDAEINSMIARVTVDTTVPSYPVRHAGQTIWPTGRYITTLSGPELYTAHRLGHIAEYHHASTYYMRPSMSLIASELLRIRIDADNAGDPMVAAWAKSVAVCLPGRMGQRHYEWIMCADCPASEPYGAWIGTDATGKPVRYRALDWTVYKEVISPHAADSVPSIAAWITSAGRRCLAAAIEIAHRCHCYYCDTDSLMVDDVGYQRLADSGMVRDGKPGYLQLKGVHGTAGFYGVKHYHLDGELRCSGLSHGSLIEGPTSRYHYHRIHALRQMSEGRRPQAEIRRMTFERNGVYPLGRVTLSGEVTPYHLGS